MRLRQHNKLKDWWTSVLVCISKTQDFTKAHVKYLEWHCHQEIQTVGRYQTENGSIPTKSFVPETVIADLMDHFETLWILVSSLGHPFFDRPQASVKAKEERLVCKGKKAFAYGEYVDDGFLVFEGGIANKAFSNSSAASVEAARDRLVESGTMVPADEDTYRFYKDHLFSSPSQAAAIVLARSANGWIEWKYPDGRTLDEVKRKS
jgi:hypothetical protein